MQTDFNLKHILVLNAWVQSEWTAPTFSEYRHVVYPIKRNETHDNIHATILPLHTLGTGCGQKVITICFSESGHVEYQIKGEENLQQHEV